MSHTADTESEILALDDRWATARIRGDAAMYDSITAEDFIGVSASGTVATKQDRLREFTQEGDVGFDAITSTDRRVRVYGDTAILTGTTTITGQRRGQPFAGTYRYTHVFVRRDDRWQAASAHMSLLRV